jgi:hypothetical protein
VKRRPKGINAPLKDGHPAIQKYFNDKKRFGNDAEICV